MSGEPSAITAGKGGPGDGADELRHTHQRRRGPTPLRVGVYGALGRMGQMIVRCLLAPPESEPARSPAAPGLLLTVALASSRCAHLGHDVGPLCGASATGVDISGNLQAALPLCDVVIDFSTPAATELLAAAAAAAQVPLVIGTTGLHPAALAAISAAAVQIPIVRSANMSPGVNVLLGLLRRASRALYDYDAEIVELHHRQKRDAPSGTALLLAEAIKAGRETALELRSGREGQVGPRGPAELGVFAMRGGDVIGEHTALLLGSGERIELVHRATAREVFALGALRAARWLCAEGPPGSPGQKPGLYDMEDVLGLREP